MKIEIKEIIKGNKKKIDPVDESFFEISSISKNQDLNDLIIEKTIISNNLELDCLIIPWK